MWLFAVPAQFGLKGVQFFSALIFLSSIFFSWKILELLGLPFASWVIPFIGFQPVLFNVSYTAMAELPTAFLIVLSYYFYLKDRYALVMLLSSAIFLFRLEYCFVAIIFLLIYLSRRKWKAILIFFWAPAFWFLVSWLATGYYWRFHYDLALHSRLPKLEQGIHFFHYPEFTPVIFGIVQTFFFLVALFFILKKVPAKLNLPLLFVFLGYIVHTLMAAEGFKFARSAGDMRYLSVIGPMFGIIAVYGAGKFLNIFKTPRTLFIGTLLFALLFFLGPLLTPFHKKTEMQNLSDEIVESVDSQYADYFILSNIQDIGNAEDQPASGGGRYAPLNKKNLFQYEKKIIVWLGGSDQTPFVEDIASLPDIMKLHGIKHKLTVSALVDHRPDIPAWNFFSQESGIRLNLFNYLTHNQYTWENFEIRVFSVP